MIRRFAAAALVALLAGAALAAPPATGPTVRPPIVAPRAPSTAVPAGLTPVPRTEVALWAGGSTWCLNPDEDRCDVLYYWNTDDRRRQIEIAALALGDDENDGVLMVSSPWELRDGRQCYRVQEEEIVFVAVSPDQSPNQEAADAIETEWRDGLRATSGQNHCVTFYRDAATGLVRQQRTIDGVLQPFEENEAFRVTVGAEEGGGRAI